MYIHVNIADGIWYDNMTDLPCLLYEYTAVESLFLHSSDICGDYCMYIESLVGGTATKSGINASNIHSLQTVNELSVAWSFGFCGNIYEYDQLAYNWWKHLAPLIF